jgi:D-alanyl-D-alanine carboxypeptidase
MYVLFFLGLLIFACTSDHDEDQKNASIRHLIDQVCRETGTPGVSVHVISPDRGQSAFVTGIADRDTRTAVVPESVFRVGSLTKSFTGAAIITLVEDGLVALDAPISDYLGIVGGYTHLSDISVGNLLNMSSGLAECLNVSFLTGTVLADPSLSHTPEDLLDEAFNTSPDLLFTPGSSWFYTNTNYILLGLLIEAVSGISYEDYIEQTFITPLGLNDTRVMLDSTILEGMVRGYYDYDEDGYYEDWTEINMSYVWSAGCIVSSARDMAVWMRAMATGSIVSEPFQSYLSEGQIVAEGVMYGAGILVDTGFGTGHNGTVVGYHADAWHDPETGITVAVLCNTNSPILDDERDPTREITEGILAILK